MTGYKDPNVFTIAAGQSFLPTVAEALCSGNLIEGFAYDGDPLALSRATIFVPTRRAARELRSALMDHLGGSSILLPQIRPLGEFDEDAQLFEGNAEEIVKVPPPIDTLERQLMLGRMIAQWTNHLTDHLRGLYKEEELTTPVSTADAFWLAKDLANLIDQLQTEDLSFADIQAAGDAEVSQWWDVTLAFLQILRTEWPAILKDRNRIDPAEHRNAMLRGEAKRLGALQPTDPVIVAGSTGTIPATADLISTIAKLPGGAVVLPGYDLDMSDATAELLNKPVELSSAISHPQFGMHHLVHKMGANGLVRPLGDQQSISMKARDQWVKTALEPAPQTFRWNMNREKFDDAAFEDVAILNAPNEREEAACIAAALREAIANPKTTTALVTPDRMLARRVVTELARYGIEADDSGGTPFDATAQGSLLAFVFSVVFEPGDPAALLALLKNPIVQIGVDVQTHNMQTAWLERLALRGGVGRFSIDTLVDFIEAQLAKLRDDESYRPDWVRKLTSEEEQQAKMIAERLQAAFAPLSNLASMSEKLTLETALTATILVLEALAKDDTGDHSPLYAGEAGTMLRNALTQFMASESGLVFEASQWPEILRAVTSGLLVKPNSGGHPRVAIWGALEARLQSVDFLVLGGLNEGIWPQQTSNDPFLTRGMKMRMNMQPPERRIGLASHDFQMGMGQKKVLLTRSARIENAPAVASRWVQRLETLAGKQATKELHKRGERYLHIVRAIEATENKPLEKRPNFAPPLYARPKHFSVTEIERLRRDPYAIYAKRILDLKPLDPLTRDPDAAERGTLIHKILEDITLAGLNYSNDDVAGEIQDIAARVFEKVALPDDIEIIWRARFDALVGALIEWERGRDELGVTRYAEIRANKLPIADTGVTLGGRPDRLDQRRDGLIDIVDFKTGGAPSAKQVQTLLAPQMPLEVALLKRGGFSDVNGDAAELLYITLGPTGKVDVKNVCGTGKNAVDANELGQAAWEKLVQIINYYADEKNGYISRAVPALQHDYGGEYDHLARVLEWSAGVDSDMDAGDAS